MCGQGFFVPKLCCDIFCLCFVDFIGCLVVRERFVVAGRSDYVITALFGIALEHFGLISVVEVYGVFSCTLSFQREESFWHVDSKF